MEQLIESGVLAIASIICLVGIVVGCVIGTSYYAAAKNKLRAAAKQTQEEAVAQVVQEIKKGQGSDCPTLVGFLAANPDGLCGQNMEGTVWKIESIEQRPYRDERLTVTLSRPVKTKTQAE